MPKNSSSPSSSENLRRETDPEGAGAAGGGGRAGRATRWGDLHWDQRNGWLVVGDQRANLPPAVGRLLGALIAARGGMVSADALRAVMRKPGNPEVSPENMRQGLWALRRALVATSARTRVEARIGYGWRLDASQARSTR
jgi:hypothetical protein